jgi:hypothetical protein
MGRVRFAPVATGYVVVVALLTVASRLPAYRSDLVGFVAVAATLPAGLVYPVLALVPHHLGWYALPLVALLNAFVLRRLRTRDRRVEDRLHRALVATGVKVTPMAQPGRRRQRSLLLRDVPIVYPQFVGVFRERWVEAGLRVRQQDEPLVLRGRDTEGYEFAVEPGPGVFGDALLSVTAPPSRHRAFAAGLTTGGVPCLVAALTEAYAGLLLIGCGALVGGLACLAGPRARAFGRGLLTGGGPALVVLLLYGLA